MYNDTERWPQSEVKQFFFRLLEDTYGMSIRNTRLSEADVDQHIADLIYFGENPKAEVFWDRVRVFIASYGDMRDRTRLVYWWLAQKKKHMGK